MKRDTEYTLMNKDSEMRETRKIVTAERLDMQKKSSGRFFQMKSRLSASQKHHRDVILSAKSLFDKRRLATKGDYEERLGKESFKEQRLDVELASLRQKHVEKMHILSVEFEERMSAMRQAQDRALKEWKTEYDRLVDCLRSDGKKCEERLRNKEDHFEKIVSDVAMQQRQSLQEHSVKSTCHLLESVKMKSHVDALLENVSRVQDQLSNRQTELDRVKNMFAAQRATCSKVEYLLRQKDSVIDAKSVDITDRRKAQKHLESFRYVLYHKVRCLEKHQEPLVNIVSKYRDEVRDMYNEFVAQFRNKDHSHHSTNESFNMISFFQIMVITRILK